MKKILFAAVILAAALVSCNKKNNDPVDPYEGKTNPSTICADNLIAYFPFDGAATENINSVEPNKVGAGVAYEAGRRGQAYKGAADNVLAYDATAIKGVTSLKNFSFACWMKHQAVPQSSAPTPFFFGITDKDAFWGHLAFCLDRGGLDNTDSLAVKIAVNGDMWAAPGLGQAGIIAGKWAHVVCTFAVCDTAQDMHFYVNGVAAPAYDLHWDGTHAVTNFSTANTVLFGQWRQKVYDAATDEWMGNMDGDLDEFRLYNAALTAEQAKALYDAEVSVMD